MKPTRQTIASRTSGAAPYITGVNTQRIQFLAWIGRWAIIVFVTFCIGIMAGSAWVRSHPCMVAPGGQVELVIGAEGRGPGGEDRQTVKCGVDGEGIETGLKMSKEEQERQEEERVGHATILRGVEP